MTTIQSGRGTVLLDASRLIWRSWTGRLPTGIDRTCLAYADHYRGSALAVVQRKGWTRILSRSASAVLFKAILSGDRMADRRGIVRALTLGLATASPRCTEGMIYLNVGHTGLNRPGHAEWVRRTGVRAVYFIHDLIPITHPQYCREGEAMKHRARVRTMLATGTGIIANSADTLAAMTKFGHLESLPVPENRLVSPLGVEAGWLNRVTPGQSPVKDKTPYFVTLGTIEGRKNHILLLRVWADMARSLGSACPKLVIVGQRGWSCDEAISMLDNDPMIQTHVEERTNCGDAELVELMAGARALLFPSHAEGYGIPLVEALAQHTPVIASDLAVFREIAGNLIDYIAPDDRIAWRARVEAYIHETSSFHLAQKARLKSAAYRAPDWPAHFKRVDTWLRTIRDGPLRAVG